MLSFPCGSVRGTPRTALSKRVTCAVCLVCTVLAVWLVRRRAPLITAPWHVWVRWPKILWVGPRTILRRTVAKCPHNKKKKKIIITYIFSAYVNKLYAWNFWFSIITYVTRHVYFHQKHFSSRAEFEYSSFLPESQKVKRFDSRFRQTTCYNGLGLQLAHFFSGLIRNLVSHSIGYVKQYQYRVFKNITFGIFKQKN